MFYLLDYFVNRDVPILILSKTLLYDSLYKYIVGWEANAVFKQGIVLVKQKCNQDKKKETNYIVSFAKHYYLINRN